MPVFAEQKFVLKSPSTKVKFEQANPKSPLAAKLTKGMTSINQATPLAKPRTKEQIGKTSQLTLKKEFVSQIVQNVEHLVPVRALNRAAFSACEPQSQTLTTPDSPGIMEVDVASGAKKVYTEGTLKSGSDQ